MQRGGPAAGAPAPAPAPAPPPATATPVQGSISARQASFTAPEPAAGRPVKRRWQAVEDDRQPSRSAAQKAPVLSTSSSSSSSSNSSSEEEQSDDSEWNGNASEQEEDDGFIALGAAEPGAAPASAAGGAAGSVPGRTMGPTPWRRLSNRGGFISWPNSAPLLRLHEEVVAFVELIQPTLDEHTAAEDLVNRLRRIIRSIWPTAVTEVFGSRATGLTVAGSDLDMVVFGATSANPIQKLGYAITAAQMADYLELVTKARVPIVKLRDRRTQLNVDYAVVRPMLMILKFFLAQRGLNEPYMGGVGSFLLLIMVVHLVQMEVSAIARPVSATAALPMDRLNLGYLLLKFFRYYSHDLDTNVVGISVRHGGACIDKAEKGWYQIGRPALLCAENPVDPTVDVGGNAFAYNRVQQAFEFAYQSLVGRISSPPGSQDSILSGIIRIDPSMEVRVEQHDLPPPPPPPPPPPSEPVADAPAASGTGTVVINPLAVNGEEGSDADDEPANVIDGVKLRRPKLLAHVIQRTARLAKLAEMEADLIASGANVLVPVTPVKGGTRLAPLTAP